MVVRRVALAFVSSVFFAALGANSGPSLASTNSANSLSAEAYAALSGGDSARSVTLYSQAIDSRQLGPEGLANALLNRALAYQLSQQTEKALQDYSTALSLDAMTSELRSTALYNRGLAQISLKRLPMAIEDFTSALLINSGFSHAYYARANALRDSGQYLFAISDYERALKYNHPQSARVYFGEAQTYKLLKRPADAKRLLLEAISIDATFQPALDELKSIGDVADTEETAGDPILTGSVAANASGSTEVVKPALPAAVEPPAELMASAEKPADVPIEGSAQKEIVDRVPVENSMAGEAVAGASAKPRDAGKVIIASVPKIPSQQEPAGENDGTASVDPSPVAQAAAPAQQLASVEPAQQPMAPQQPVKLSGWSVQVASAASEEAAWNTWKNMVKSHKILAGKTPVVIKADLGKKGIFYRVRLTGFDDQASALSACGKLKSGGVSCFISKAAG